MSNQTEQPSLFRGIKDETLGAVKENIGHVLGNQQMEFEGKHQKMKGEAEVSAAKGGVESSSAATASSSSSSSSQEDPRKKHPQPPFAPQTQEHPGQEWKMDPKPDYGVDSYKGSNKLAGKVAVVTGGDSGIGRAVCLAFAREGCKAIVVSYLNEHKDAEETRQAIFTNPFAPSSAATPSIAPAATTTTTTTTTTGTTSTAMPATDQNTSSWTTPQCLLIPGDISDDNVCKTIIDQTVRQFGKIDILVNNAAYQGKAVEDISDLTPERVLYTFKTNILSMFSLVRYALPHMNTGGSIINVGSIQGYEPSENILDYAVTKGAIINFTKGLSKYTIQKGVRCNCIAPGPIWTPLIVQSFGSSKISEFGKKSPTGRPGQPAECAPAFVFLASKDASFINGQVIGITGGEIMP